MRKNYYNTFKLMIIMLLCAMALTAYCAAEPAETEADGIQKQFAALEAASNGRLGIHAINTADGSSVGYRADERFPLCSTFKVMLVGAILKKSMGSRSFMKRRISYKKSDLVLWSPITEKYAGAGMSVKDLCSAAIQYSDNTASNLLLKLLGGPEELTAFAGEIGDRDFRLDRWETPLSSAVPGDPQDTTTPKAMAESLRILALGDVLGPEERNLMQTWLKGNTTGGQSIRAGVPAGWLVGDKTGSGHYGTTNDIAIIRPPEGAPIIMAIYFTQSKKNAPARKDVLASAASLIIKSKIVSGQRR